MKKILVEQSADGCFSTAVGLRVSRERRSMSISVLTSF